MFNKTKRKFWLISGTVILLGGVGLVVENGWLSYRANWALISSVLPLSSLRFNDCVRYLVKSG
jgi:hypothetical protein